MYILIQLLAIAACMLCSHFPLSFTPYNIDNFCLFKKMGLVKFKYPLTYVIGVVF